MANIQRLTKFWKLHFLIVFLFSIFYFLFSTPATVSAAGLVPCGGEDEPPCKFCDLFKLGQNIINFLLEKVSPALAIAFIIYGGIMMMLNSGNPSKLKESQGIIWSVVIGVVIALTVWIILNTFFHLLTGGLAWPWDEIKCL
jgi:type IV secretory pathway VirB2 component (pilin)